MQFSLRLRELCTKSRFQTHFLNRLRYVLINFMLNLEFLCKAPSGRG